MLDRMNLSGGFKETEWNRILIEHAALGLHQGQQSSITLEALRGERIAYDEAKTFLLSSSARQPLNNKAVINHDQTNMNEMNWNAWTGLVKVFDLARKNSKLLRNNTKEWNAMASKLVKSL